MSFKSTDKFQVVIPLWKWSRKVYITLCPEMLSFHCRTTSNKEPWHTVHGLNPIHVTTDIRSGFHGTHVHTNAEKWLQMLWYLAGLPVRVCVYIRAASRPFSPAWPYTNTISACSWNEYRTIEIMRSLTHTNCNTHNPHCKLWETVFSAICHGNYAFSDIRWYELSCSISSRESPPETCRWT